MIGIYPDVPGVPEYTLSLPVFDRVTVKLNPKYHGSSQLVIEKAPSAVAGAKNHRITLDGKKAGYRISHSQLLSGSTLRHM